MTEIIITEKQQQRNELYARIAARYSELNVPGASITAVISTICKEMGVCPATVYKVRRLYNQYRPIIDRRKVVEHYSDLIDDGMAAAAARKATAARFKCTQGYVFQILKLAQI